MERISYSAVCLGIAVLCAATFLPADDEPSGKAKPEAPYSYTFSKREFGTVSRTNVTLDVKLRRPDLVVSVVCFLQDEKQSMGRFPLGNVNSNVADAPLRFRITCLADALIGKSTLRVAIRDAKTNEYVGIRELPLRDAVSEAASISVKER